ncbi:MAG: 1-acyl-sn-glycerol-3-phosphate acyltransferase [Treponema sp.]|nr:1-acyl-sn-glycerol-3-phosphate acyltransferase [Treponema sp.]
MIKTILIFLYLSISMILLILPALIIGFLYLIGLRNSMRLIFYRLAQGWGHSIIKMAGCSVTVSGRENIPRKNGICFVSNHCGFFDIVLLLAYCGRPFGFVAKKELLLIPFLNIWIFLLGGLFIDRKNVRKAIRTINKGIRRIKSGGGMIIFPEGHRSKGRGLLPFHPGSLKLATEAKAPIVPVAISGSYEVFERTYRAVSSPVKISFLKPINTADLPPADRKHVLSDRIYSIIKEELGEGNAVI